MAELKWDALEAAIPRATVEATLQASGLRTQRARKLNLALTVFSLIALHLYPRMSIAHVLQKIYRGLRYVWGDGHFAVPGASALNYRRDQLGIRPLRQLVRQVCQPVTTPDTAGAFLGDWRLVALDSTIEDVPDTPANAQVFGRATSHRGDSAFPQVRVALLSECGAHTILAAEFVPYHVSERAIAPRLLRAVHPDMLLLWDRGFHAYDLVEAVRARGAQLLGRVPAGVKPQHLETLADGSYLALLRASAEPARRHGDGLRVRIIEYTLTDPALPGYGQTHRLLTTLLDAARYPALDLVCAYHARWEIELVFDELRTHQRLADGPLRSLTPRGVIQELYGLILAHYAVRSLMHAAAVRVGIDPDRLSFVHALEVIRDAVPEFQMTAPAQQPQLYERLLDDLSHGRLPQRQLRSNPRVVKRKMSNFPLKRAVHRQPPKPTRSFRDSVAIII